MAPLIGEQECHQVCKEKIPSLLDSQFPLRQGFGGLTGTVPLPTLATLVELISHQYGAHTSWNKIVWVQIPNLPLWHQDLRQIPPFLSVLVALHIGWDL